MNKIKGIILSFLITALIGTLLFMSYMTEESFAMPDSIYQVYLDGEKIGLVESKEELYSLINKEQKEIKKEYNVNQVYPPKGFKIIRQTTYKEEVNSIEEVYEAIKEKKQFTIKGYSITIKGSLEGVEPQYVYVIDETIFEKALSNVVVTFIGEGEVIITASSTKNETVKSTVTFNPYYIVSSNSSYSPERYSSKSL